MSTHRDSTDVSCVEHRRLPLSSQPGTPQTDPIRVFPLTPDRTQIKEHTAPLLPVAHPRCRRPHSVHGRRRSQWVPTRYGLGPLCCACWRAPPARFCVRVSWATPHPTGQRRTGSRPRTVGTHNRWSHTGAATTGTRPQCVPPEHALPWRWRDGVGTHRCHAATAAGVSHAKGRPFCEQCGS